MVTIETGYSGAGYGGCCGRGYGATPEVPADLISASTTDQELAEQGASMAKKGVAIVGALVLLPFLLKAF